MGGRRPESIMVDGAALRAFRELCGLKPKQICARSGLSESSLFDLEQRRPRRPHKRGSLEKVLEVINQELRRKRLQVVAVEQCLDREAEMLGDVLEFAGAGLESGTREEADLESDLHEAFAEAAPVRRRKLLERFIEKAGRPGPAMGLRAELLALAHGKLADIAIRHSVRRTSRREAIKILLAALQGEGKPRFRSVLILAECCASLKWDGLRTDKLWWRATKVAKAALYERGNSVLKGPIETHSMAAPLLIARARLLRVRALSVASSLRKTELGEAMRCIGKALYLYPAHPVALVETAQICFAMAHVRDETEWESLLVQAERALCAAEEQQFSGASLALARFFRLTYRPEESLAAYQRFATRSTSREAVLKHAYIAGEAAGQSWYRDRAEAMENVRFARTLMQEAVASGYCQARHVLALTILTAILDGVDPSKAQVMLLTENASTTWIDIIDLAVSYTVNADTEGLREAFVFGMDDPSNWNTLGTYVKDFLKDRKRAQLLYEGSLRLGPHNHVALLNLGQLLKDHGEDDASLRALSAAKAIAPPHFRRFLA